MAAYEYLALTGRGREQRGVLEGDSARHVRQLLRERGLSALEVTPVAGRSATAHAAAGGRERVPAAELVIATRQLATLARAGLPVGEVLATVAEQSTRPATRRVLLGVRGRVVEGVALSDALQDYPRVFAPFYRATVAAGEQSGRLAEVLERLADHVERGQALRQKLGLSLVYPALVLLVAVAVIGVMMVYVVPEVVRVFTGIGQELPWFTRALIATSEQVQRLALPASLLLLVALAGGALLLRLPGARLAFDRLQLGLPLVGGVVRRLNGARFVRTLAILTASAVPLLDGVQLASGVVPNRAQRRALLGVARQIREGRTLHASLRETGLFPPVVLNLIASGESGGRLADMLDRAATQQEREIELGLAALVGLLEPLMIVLLGGIILAIVVAILLPIFQLNQLVTL
ncbi:MAG: type II secretion system inner membrane protein GspF [Gammaproteobacteria bacterium]|nr:type II secretion system inner membrane protein GspF [Gammaproteobacteria bacterium]